MNTVRIFLAEDNLGDVWLIEEALKRQSLNFTFDYYSTAEEAIHAVNTCGNTGRPVPDLMLLDYNLPRGHGCDVLEAAAKNPKLASVPKAIVTSFLQPDEITNALQLGASCFITKPADLEQFFEDIGGKVSELLRLHPAAEKTKE
jgi:CheY-like chemotaxis protein